MRAFTPTDLPSASATSMIVVTLSSEDPMFAERADQSLVGLPRCVALAALLVGTASPLLGQNPAPAPPACGILDYACFVRTNPSKILTSYSGEIAYKGE